MALILMYRVVLDPNWIPSNSFERDSSLLATDGAALLATAEIDDDVDFFYFFNDYRI